MTYEYKGYNPGNSKYVQKYNRDHYKTVTIRFDPSFYNDELKPLADSFGVPVATLVKKVIADYVRQQVN